jgi:hypothetical protein
LLEVGETGGCAAQGRATLPALQADAGPPCAVAVPMSAARRIGSLAVGTTNSASCGAQHAADDRLDNVARSGAGCGLQPPRTAVTSQTDPFRRTDPSNAARGRGALPREATARQLLCADIDGFSLHAAVRVDAHDRKRLEQLCRYITRPALSDERVLSCLDLATVTSRNAAAAGPSAHARRVGVQVLRVGHVSDGAALMRRAAPPWLRFGVAAWCEVVVMTGAAQAAKPCPPRALGPWTTAADQAPGG